MAGYKVNGYDLYAAFGIVPDGDKSTANSFEKGADTVDVFSHTWEDGVVEYDLDAPTQYKPRLFIIKGYLIMDTYDDYMATRMAIQSVFDQNYVTLEHIESGEKSNAKIKGGTTWNRLTNLNSSKIIVAVQFNFDEVLMHGVPFKDDGLLDITYYVDDEQRYYLTQDNKNYIS